MMTDKFHFRLETIKFAGSITSDRGDTWQYANYWYERESATKHFPHRSVKVYLCVSDDSGELRTEDEVLVLGTK